MELNGSIDDDKDPAEAATGDSLGVAAVELEQLPSAGSPAASGKGGAGANGTVHV
jgi:hypothetical protein